MYKGNEIMAVVPQEKLEAIQSELSEIKALLLEKQSSSQSKGEQYLSSREAAELLGIDPRTLIVWRKKGVLKGSKVGKKVYYKRSEVTALIDRNELN